MALQSSIGATFTNPDGSFKTPRPQTIIALTFTFVSAWIFLQGNELPGGLGEVTLLIVGFFFGDQSRSRTASAPALPDPVSG